MNDNLYHYIDPAFSHLEVGNYRLLLLLNESNFELAVMHGQKLMVWRKAASLAELTQPGEVQEVLNFDFHEVITGICTPYFTLVPQTLYEAEQTASIARYLDVKPDDTVFAQTFDAQNQVVFKTPAALTTAAAQFDLQKVVFAHSGWVQAIAANQPSNYHLYLNLLAERFEVAYFRQGKLHLLNSFAYTHPDELAYFTLFVCQQLKLDRSLTTVMLSGAASNPDKLQQLSAFFKAVEYNSITLAEIPGNLAKYQLLALTSLTLCASLADA